MTLAREGYDGVLADAGLKRRRRRLRRHHRRGRERQVRHRPLLLDDHARPRRRLPRPERPRGGRHRRAQRPRDLVDERGKVLSYKMTSQCASGSGQFLENIARYLGVAVEEIGPLS
jgi:benzoyl-CoA reductase subunit D